MMTPVQDGAVAGLAQQPGIFAKGAALCSGSGKRVCRTVFPCLILLCDEKYFEFLEKLCTY
jgi:hypothetical protein